MNLFELSAKISVDDSNFKKSMENAQKVSKKVATAIKNLQSPLDKAKSGFKAIAHPVETAKANIEKLKNATEAIRHPIETFKNKVADASTALETKRNKLSTLAAGYDAAKKKVADITKEFNKSAKESGTSSQKTQELAKKLNEAEKEAEEAKKELDDYSKSVSKAGKNSDSASKGVGSFASKLGKGLATAGKIGVAAVGAASTAIVALGKIGLDYNKQIETYTTNFEVMMGDAEAAAKKVEELKEMGARTPFELGDLANATQTLLAFNVSADESTGVLSKLGDISLGNVQKLESLTRAYGKMNASQKVTLEDVNMMIDAGFNPLLIVAEETGKTMTEVYDDISKGKVSFEQIEDAISKATSAGGQFYQGMQKASQTTEGLISTLKDNATALVGEVFTPISEGLTKKVLPSAINAINTLSEAFKTNGIEGMVEASGEILGNVVTKIVDGAPKFVELAVTIVDSLVNGLLKNQKTLARGAISIITTLANGLLKMLPKIVKLGLDLIVSLAKGVSKNLPKLIPTAVDVVLQIVETLTDPGTLSNLLDASIEIIIALADGIINSLPKLLAKAPVIISNLVTAIIQSAPKLLQSALQIVSNIVTGIINNLPKIGATAGKIISTIVNGVSNLWSSIKSVGSNIVSGVWAGIQASWSTFYNNVKTFFSNIVTSVKSFLGIRSPSRVFRDEIGKQMAAGVGVGFEDEFSRVKDDIDDALKFDDASIGINASIRKAGTGAAGGAFGGTSIGNITINIDGAKYSDEQSLASAVAQEIQNMTDRRVAVYA